MKETNPKSIILYKEWKIPLQCLSLEQKGKILDALLDFPAKPEFDDQMLVMAWAFMEGSLERNAQKWDDIREKRAAAGRKGAETTNGKVQQNAANPANADFAEQNAANPAVYVNANVSSYVSNKEISPIGDIKKGANAPMPTPETKTARFHPPDMEEVKAYFAEKGGTNAQAERFFTYYESNGWRVGKNPMKKWKAAALGWISRDKDQASGYNRKPTETVDDQLARVLAKMDRERGFEK